MRWPEIILIRSQKSMLRFLMIFGAALFGLLTAPASAQQPCNGTPGERQIGMHPAGVGGAPPVPMCVIDGPPMVYASNYIAVISHPDANKPWLAYGFRSKEAAEQAGLTSCNRDMGGNCTILFSTWNSHVAIGRGYGGHLVAGGGASKGAAESNVKKHCRKQGDECVIIQTAWVSAAYERQDGLTPDSFSRTVLPPSGDYRRTHAAAAWMDSSEPEQFRFTVWVQGGFRSEQMAKDALLARCRQDSGRPCDVARTVQDSAITIGMDSDGHARAGTGFDEQSAVKEQEKRCKEAKVKCQVTLVYAAARRDLVVHDIRSEALRLSGGKIGAAKASPSKEAPAARAGDKK